MENFEDIISDNDCEFENIKNSRIKNYERKNRHNNNLYKKVKRHGYYHHYLFMDEVWIKNHNHYSIRKLKKPYVRKIYESSNTSVYKFYQKQANRAVRRNKNICYNGSDYKKVYEYYYEVY